MTVKELIEELKAYPPDVEVMIPSGESPYYDFTNIVRSDEDYAMAVIIEQGETMYNEELAVEATINSYGPIFYKPVAQISDIC